MTEYSKPSAAGVPAGEKGIVVTVRETVIHITFSAHGNSEIAALVRDVLKNAYVQRQAG